jgi:hypothetical protein
MRKGTPMTVTIYEMHAASACLCFEAKEAFEQPSALSKAEAVGNLALARLFSLAACAKSVSDTVLMFWRRVVKIVAIPFFSNFSFDSFARMAISTALAVTLTALRILSSFGGIISPELTFGVLKLHRFLLYLGCVYRSQFSYIGSAFPPPLNLIQNRINDQRWRCGIVTYVMRHVNEVESRHEILSRIRFQNDVWEPAERQALEDEVTRLLEDFRRPVLVSHPVLETFQEQFSKALHREALTLCQQNLYTKDEVEDLVTAFLPVMHRATYKAIVETFRLTEKDLSLGNRDIISKEIVLEDGRKIILKEVLLADGSAATVQEAPLIDGQIIRSMPTSVPVGRLCKIERRALHDGERICLDNVALVDGREVAGGCAGGLEHWKQQLLEILILFHAMPEADRDALSYYLCADEGRILRVLPAYPNISTRPILDRCFKLIIEFYTTFVAHHMPSDSNVLLDAFALPEIF